MTCTASTRREKIKKKIATTSSKRCVEKTSTTALRAKDEKEQLVKRVIRRGKKCFNPSSSGLESVSAVPRSGKPLRRKFRRLFVAFGSVSRCRGLLPAINFSFLSAVVPFGESVVKTRRKTAPLGFPPVASRPPRASSVRREFGVCIIVVRNSAVCSISHLVGVGVGHTAAAAVQDGALFGSLFFPRWWNSE